MYEPVTTTSSITSSSPCTQDEKANREIALIALKKRNAFIFNIIPPMGFVYCRLRLRVG